MNAIYPNSTPYVNPYMNAISQIVTSQMQPQPMSPPIIHTDIIPVNSEAEVNNWAVGNGQTLVFMMRDDSAIFFKTGSPNGAVVEYYDHRNVVNKAPEYVTRAELENMLQELKAQTNDGGKVK